jgi:hypothetical protein
MLMHRLVLDELLVREDLRLLGLAIPEHQPAAGVAVAGRAGEDDVAAVGMHEQVVRPVDVGRRLREEARVRGGVVLHGVQPTRARGPIQA